jgi:hypothetical protein
MLSCVVRQCLCWRLCLLFTSNIAFLFILFSSRNRLVNSRHHLAIDTTARAIMVMFSSATSSQKIVCVDTLLKIRHTQQRQISSIKHYQKTFLSSPCNVITVFQFRATILAYLWFVTRPLETTSHLLVQLLSGTFWSPPPLPRTLGE